MSDQRNESSYSAGETLRRTACDRCHAQKLRCPREGNSSDVCGRCRKAQVDCVFSSPLRMGRPSGRQRNAYVSCRKHRRSAQKQLIKPISSISTDPEGETQASDGAFHSSSYADTYSDSFFSGRGGIEEREHDHHQNSFDVDGPDSAMNWHFHRSLSPLSSTLENLNADIPLSTLDLNNFQVAEQKWAATPEDQQPCQFGLSPRRALFHKGADCSDELATSEKSNTIKSFQQLTPISMENFVSQLADLNISLYRNGKIISSANGEPSSKNQHHPALLDSDYSTYIEETFRACQKLIELLHRLFAQFQEQEPWCGENSDSHSTSISPTSRSYDHNLSHTEIEKPDKSTVFLILACYLRVLDVFDLLLKSFRHQLQSSLYKSDASAGEKWLGGAGSIQMQLPGLRLGSFSPPSSSEIQIVLVVQVVAHLLDRMDKAMVLVTTTNEHDRFTDDTMEDGCTSSIGTYAEKERGETEDEMGTFRSDWNSATSHIAEQALKEVGTQERRAKRNLKRVRDLLKESIAL